MGKTHTHTYAFCQIKPPRTNECYAPYIRRKRLSLLPSLWYLGNSPSFPVTTYITFGQADLKPHHLMWKPKANTTDTTLCMQCGRMALPCDPNSVLAPLNACIMVSTWAVSRLGDVQGVRHRYGLETSTVEQRDSCAGN